VCWAPIGTLKDAIDDPYTRERGMVLTDADGHNRLSIAIRFAHIHGRVMLELRDYGAHLRALAKEAGLDDSQIDALIARGVI
jgi:crotonobetainyl-CoA:carnitine CoA-transferase CaiB-like acyl-CoA transferase